MSLLSSVVSSLVPGMKPIAVKTYRQLLSETGRYAGMLDGYRPYRADHEPPDRAVTERRAKIPYQHALAAEVERTAEIRSLLKRQVSFGI